MLAYNEIIQETLPKLNENFFEKILSQASNRDLFKFIKYFKDHDDENSQSEAGSDILIISSKTSNELTGFFNKIAENLDTLFYQDCTGVRFLSLLYKDIDSAKERLESGKPLEPEKHLEFQPSAYSGFDDRFSQQDFANILFVIAIANYANNKSQGKIEEDKFIDVLKSMNEKNAKQREELSREPRFLSAIPYSNLFLSLAVILNLTTLICEAGETTTNEMNRNIDDAFKTRNNIERIYNYNFEKAISRNNYTKTEIEILRQNQTSLIALEYDKYNVTQTDIDSMIKNRNEKMMASSFGATECLLRMSADGFFGTNGLHNANTKFLLFVTSLFFASEAMAETINGKNLIKTFIDRDEPTSVDNRLLVDALRIGLLFASQFDSRFKIDRIANNIIRNLSSLGCGAINCFRSLYKSREASSDIESGPLIDDKISSDQIKQIAQQFTKLLTNLHETIPADPRNSSPSSELTPHSSAIISSSNMQKT